jgi:hypothetical protein
VHGLAPHVAVVHAAACHFWATQLSNVSLHTEPSTCTVRPLTALCLRTDPPRAYFVTQVCASALRLLIRGTRALSYTSCREGYRCGIGWGAESATDEKN